MKKLLPVVALAVLERILKLTSLDSFRKERKNSESLTEILKEQKERFRASAI